jgi:hypothetical protein
VITHGHPSPTSELFGCSFLKTTMVVAPGLHPLGNKGVSKRGMFFWAKDGGGGLVGVMGGGDHGGGAFRHISPYFHTQSFQWLSARILPKNHGSCDGGGPI